MPVHEMLHQPSGLSFVDLPGTLAVLKLPKSEMAEIASKNRIKIISFVYI